jgi:hypothetical protein
MLVDVRVRASGLPKTTYTYLCFQSGGQTLVQRVTG